MSAASAAGGQSWAVHEHGSLKRGRALNRREDKVRLGGGGGGQVQKLGHRLLGPGGREACAQRCQAGRGRFQGP